MAVTELLREAATAGLHLFYDAGRIGVRGEPALIGEWMPRLRSNRHELLAAYKDAVAVAVESIPERTITRQPSAAIPISRVALTPKTFLVAIPGRETFGVTCPQGEEAVRAQWPTATSIRAK